MTNLCARVLPSFILLILSSSVLAQEKQLIWHEDFNYTGLPDETKWSYEEGAVRNGEAQLYTVKDNTTAWVDKGYLTIRAYEAGYWPASNLLQHFFSKQRRKQYHSASLTTKHLPGWQYGRIEVRAKLPQGRGVWPAIWLLGKNVDQVGWPNCGEIDIMEYVGYKPNTIHSVIHSEAYNHQRNAGISGRTDLQDLGSKFHTYAVDRYPDRIDFWIDDHLHFSYPKEQDNPEAWPFDNKMYLIINLAIGGSWGGQKGIDDSIFPQSFIIDDVKVYSW